MNVHWFKTVQVYYFQVQYCYFKKRRRLGMLTDNEPGTHILFKDPVLSIMHCALQKSAAIYLMLKNPVGLIALCNPFASAMSVVKRLFMYLI